MPGRMELKLGDRVVGDARRRRSGPLRSLVLGNFSGGGEWAGALAQRPILRLDLDNFPAVMRRLDPGVRLTLGDAVTELRFRELDDFHPDRLYQGLELFQSLRELRARLADDESFSQAAAALRQEPSTTSGTKAAPEEDEQDLVARLLGRQPREEQVREGRGEAAIGRMVRNIVAPYIVPSPDPQQAVYLASVDDAIAEQMRRLLHDPALQALESAWRSLYGLVSGLETGEALELFLLDATQEELRNELAGEGETPRESGLYQKLQSSVDGAGERPWSLILSDYTFSASPRDIQLLAGLGGIAARCGAPFLGLAAPGLLGCDSYGQVVDPTTWPGLGDAEAVAWKALQGSPVASWIGLALPRLLLRLPYGPHMDEIDSFAFQEIPDLAADQSGLLWGNPAFACARLLVEAVQRGETGLDVEGLPLVVYEQEGERRMLPCGEVWIGERAGEAILEAGLMPLLSYRNRNALRVMRLQSIAGEALDLR